MADPAQVASLVSEPFDSLMELTWEEEIHLQEMESDMTVIKQQMTEILELLKIPVEVLTSPPNCSNSHPITPPLIPNLNHVDHPRTPSMPKWNPHDFQEICEPQVRQKSLPIQNLNPSNSPRIPDSVMLSVLQELRIGRNSMNISLSTELGQCGSLHVLDLEGNQFSGEISSVLGGILGLKSLYLGGNEFSGRIPMNFSNLRKLQLLLLENNCVSGVIPEEILSLKLLDLSRQKNLSATRRSDAASWIRRTVGVVIGKDLTEQPLEEEFRVGLRNGIILCNEFNKVYPGTIPKVVEAPADSLVVQDGAALSAFQYFENLRNFLVALDDKGLPTLEASDLEPGGKGSRVVDSILALKSYSERKQQGKHGSMKYGGISKLASSRLYFFKRNTEVFMNSLSRTQSLDGFSLDHNLIEDFSFEPTEMKSSDSLHMLVRSILLDKKPEDVPFLEELLSKVMQEFDRRISNQSEMVITAINDISVGEKLAPCFESNNGIGDEFVRKEEMEEEGSFESKKKYNNGESLKKKKIKNRKGDSLIECRFFQKEFEDGTERITLESPKGWSGAYPKFHDTGHASNDSSRLRGYRNNVSRYGDYHINNSEVLPPQLGRSKEGSLQSAPVRPSISGVEVSIVKVAKPLSLSKMTPRESESPIYDRIMTDGSPWRSAECATQPRSQPGFGPGRAINQNGRLERTWLSVVLASQPDAYGNYTGKDTCLEKFPKLQRINVNCINGESAEKKVAKFCGRGVYVGGYEPDIS